MTVRKRSALFFRAVLAGCAMFGLVACGSRGPSTDAERLARGRELVQRMSARLAATPAISVTTTETRDAPSGCKSVHVSNAAYMQCGPTYYTRVANGYQVVVLK